MDKKVKDSWRLIVTTLNNYGLYKLLENDIAIVTNSLDKVEDKEIK